MKSFLVVLSLVGVAFGQWAQPGVPQDTPEVAAAKAAHFAALAAVQPKSQPAPQQWQQQQWTQPQQQWNQQAQPQWAPQGQQQWRGPIALPPGFDQNGAPLPVQDTPEVQAERSRHFSLYSTGSHITQLPAGQPAQPAWNPAPAQPSWNPAPAQRSWNPAPAQWNSAPAQSWNSAPAQPSWNQQQPGLPADTPEVAAAKAAHFAAHAQLGGRSFNQV